MILAHARNATENAQNERGAQHVMFSVSSSVKQDAGWCYPATKVSS